MKMNWMMVGQQGPVKETQNAYLSQGTQTWTGTPQVTILPQGPQPSPFKVAAGAPIGSSDYGMGQ